MNIINAAVREYFEPLTKIARYIFQFRKLSGKEQVKTVLVTAIVLLIGSFFVPHIANFYLKDNDLYVTATVVSKEVDVSDSYIRYEVNYKIAESEELISKTFYKYQWDNIKVGDKKEIQFSVGGIDYDNRASFLDFLCTLIFWLGLGFGSILAVTRLWKQLEE